MGSRKIVGETLRNLRKKRGWSQQVLGEKAGVTAREISRIERGIVKSVRAHTVKCLSEALEVTPEELSKETPSSEMPYGWRRIPIPREVYAHMNALEFLYGISKFEQLRLFPLLIALVGEWSKLWRKKKLQELREAVDEVKRLAGENNSLRFAYHVYIVEEGIGGAEEALEKRGPYDPDWAKEIAKSTLDNNVWEDMHPFVAFLLYLLKETQAEHIDIHVDEDKAFPWPIPDYSIASDLIDKLSAGDAVVRTAISNGFISFKDIPSELWPEEDSDPKAEERKEFIRRHLPESFWRYYEAEKAFLDTLIGNSSAADGDRED